MKKGLALILVCSLVLSMMVNVNVYAAPPQYNIDLVFNGSCTDDLNGWNSEGEGGISPFDPDFEGLQRSPNWSAGDVNSFFYYPGSFI